jgi:hypothetical protein
MSGNDNDNIFEKFTEVYKNIEQDDLVIFGWTILNRFSICNNLKKGQPDEYLWGSSTGFNEFDWVESAALNKSTKLYYNRIHKLINFINNILVTNKVVHWTWKYEPGNEILDEKTIKYETNGDVNDFHYNENTHLILYNKMIKEFENNNKISVDLWSEHLFQHQNTSIMMDYKIKKSSI